MAERDRFELDLAAALRTYAEDAPTDVRPNELARHFATVYPHGRGATGRWSFGSIPALAWTLILAGLLLALVVGSLVAGTRRPDQAVVVAPSPSPTPANTSPPGEGTNILATAKAGTLPPQATCPPGGNPDALGPASQERPSARKAGATAFDRHTGRIVLLADEYQIGSRTWTFDVCTNTWRRMNPPEEPRSSTDLDPVRLVYDADSDRTLAFTATGRVWSYDLAADTWTRKGWFPEVARCTPLYHDPSGLVIVQCGTWISAYDVATDTITQVRQPLPDSSGLPEDVAAVGYDPVGNVVIAAVSRSWDTPADTWTFDPGEGSWRLEGPQAPAGFFWKGGWYHPVPANDRGVFTAAAGVTAFVARQGWVVAYDTRSRTWLALFEAEDVGPGDPAYVDWCDGEPAYDPLNGQIVCRAGSSGMSAFSTATGQWSWLLEPVSNAAR